MKTAQKNQLIDLSRKPLQLSAVVGLFCAFLVAAMAGGAIWNSYHQERKAVSHRLLDSVQLLEQGLTRTFEALDLALARLAETAQEHRAQASPDPDPETLAASVRKQLRFAPHIRQILILESSGRILFDSSRRRRAGGTGTGSGSAERPPRKDSGEDAGGDAGGDARIPAARLFERWGLGPTAPLSLASGLRLGLPQAGRYLDTTPRPAVPAEPQQTESQQTEPQKTEPQKTEPQKTEPQQAKPRQPSKPPAGPWVIPVTSQNRGQVHVVAALNPGFFLSGFRTAIRGAESEAVLARADGQVLAALLGVSTTRPRWGGQAGAFDFTLSATRDMRVAPGASPLQGRDSLVAYRVSEIYPLAVILAESDADLIKAWYGSNGLLLVGMLISVLLLTALALWLALEFRRRLVLRGRVAILLRAIEQGPTAVLITDADGLISYVNASFSHIYGYSPEEALGQRPSLLKSGMVEDTTYRDLWQTITLGRTWEGVLVNRTKEGDLRWMKTAISGVLGQNQNLEHFVGVQTDITFQKESENQLQDLIARLNASNKELEHFAFVTSHDLQEPLRLVIMYLSLIERHLGSELKPEIHDYMGYVRENAKRMLTLLRDLLSYSQLVSLDTEPETVDTNAALREALTALSDAITRSGADIETQPLPSVRANQHLVVGLFRNLIANAVRYRDPSRHLVIRVTSSDAGDFWSFAVADNGMGIEADYHERVFRIFQRLFPKPDDDRTGIGLTVCKKTVERFGGRIWLDSEPGEGSTFSFTLPKATRGLVEGAGGVLMPVPATEKSEA